MKKQNNITKKVYFVCFLACYIKKKKTRKWMQNSLYEKKEDITRNVYNKCFIVSPESQGKKRKHSTVWRSFQDTKILKLMNNTLNQETEQPY